MTRFEARWYFDPLQTAPITPRVMIRGTASTYRIDWGDGGHADVKFRFPDYQDGYYSGLTQTNYYNQGSYEVTIMIGKNGLTYSRLQYTSMSGSIVDSKLSGSNRIDFIEAGSGSDRVRGGDGDDLLIGGYGDDRLIGGNLTSQRGDDDQLFGGVGDDILIGRAGDDLLTGGLGVDRLWGGTGEDTFVLAQYARLNDGNVVQDHSEDRILDFEDGLDRIDVTAWINRRAFVFIDDANFSAIRGRSELRAFENRAGDTVVKGDVDGDGEADFSVLVIGSHSLHADSFILEI
jgi:serralysin